MEFNYGEALKQQRKINGYTQEQLANKTGIIQANISYWENNIYTPSIDFCVQLANLYNISLDELVGRDSFDGAVVVTKYIESEVSKIYEQLNRQNKIKAMGYLTGLLDSQS